MNPQESQIIAELKGEGLSSESEYILRKLLDFPCPPPYRGEMSFPMINRIKFKLLLSGLLKCESEQDIENLLDEQYYKANEVGIKKVWRMLRESIPKP